VVKQLELAEPKEQQDLGSREPVKTVQAIKALPIPQPPAHKIAAIQRPMQAAPAKVAIPAINTLLAAEARLRALHPEAPTPANPARLQTAHAGPIDPALALLLNLLHPLGRPATNHHPMVGLEGTHHARVARQPA